MTWQFDNSVAMAVIALGVGGPVVCGIILTIRALLHGFKKES